MKRRSNRKTPATANPTVLMLDGSPLRAPEVVRVSRDLTPVSLGMKGRRLLERARVAVEHATSDNEPHYGINTGFGSFARKRIPDTELRNLQRNLIRSHAAGVGPPLPDDVVRAMMLLLAASLSRGHSGVRPVVVEQILGLLNAGIVPIVPEVGSCGASGDLAPLAHIALVLIGEGEARVGSRTMTGAAVLKAAGLRPLVLEAKEGLALINGTHLMAAQAALLIEDFERLFDAALAAAAMSIDACRATDAFLDPRVHTARCQPGQTLVADRLRRLLSGSQVVRSHRTDDPRVQDPYSLRCAPQVLGAAWDAFEYVRGCVQRELGAVTDNPLVFPAMRVNGRGGQSPADIVSAGNFHGMPIAIPLDVLTIALTHVAGISERRVFHMLAAFDPDAQLPAYLSPEPGLHSGLMIAQYTAAACCNEMIGLCTPASPANLSTSAGMEDYNSFGPRAAAKARRALELAQFVVATELVCAAEGLEHHRPLRSGKGVEKAHANVRGMVSRLTQDRPPSPDVAAVRELIANGSFVTG